MYKTRVLHCFIVSVSLLEGDLKEVDALREVKEELLAKKEVNTFFTVLLLFNTPT